MLDPDPSDCLVAADVLVRQEQDEEEEDEEDDEKESDEDDEKEEEDDEGSSVGAGSCLRQSVKDEARTFRQGSRGDARLAPRRIPQSHP